MNHVQIVLPVDEIFIYYEGILNDQLNFVGNNPISHMIPVLVFTGLKGIWPNEVKSQLHHKSHRPHTELHFRKLNFGLHIC